MNLSPQASRLFSLLASIVPRNSYDTGKDHAINPCPIEIGGTKGVRGAGRTADMFRALLDTPPFAAASQTGRAARETVNQRLLRRRLAVLE